MVLSEMMDRNIPKKLKIGRWGYRGVAIIAGKSAFYPGQARVIAERVFQTKFFPGERRMKRLPKILLSFGKTLFFLDFEKFFLLSSLKLFLVWNPLWTFIVTVVGNHSLASILFSWGWYFLEATIVCVFGLSVIRFFLLVEKAWMGRSFRKPPAHGTGLYLLFLAFLTLPGHFVASYVMVAGINLFFTTGAPMSARFPWVYYGIQIFWLWMLLLSVFLFRYWLD